MANPIVGNINSYTPQEAIELVSRAGVKKANMRLDKIFLSAVSAGCLLSFAAASSLSANTAPWYQENAPGLIRMIGALVFPYGLVLIVLTGADLCTGTFMVSLQRVCIAAAADSQPQYTTVSVLHGRLSIMKMLIHWFLCFWGNLAGALLVVTIIFGCKPFHGH